MLLIYLIIFLPFYPFKCPKLISICLLVSFVRHSLKEVLDTPGVMALIKDTKAAQEVSLTINYTCY